MDLVARLRLNDDGFSSIARRMTRGLGSLESRTRGVTGGMRQMGGAIKSQVSSMGGLKSGLAGVAGAYLSAQGAVKAFNSTIGAAAKFEASEVAIKAIFNDEGLSESYLKMVDKMAIDSPLLNSTEMLSSSKGLIAMTKDIDDLGKSWSIVEKLQVLDPTQGTDGATFALKEMFQGDSLSMVERFGLNKQELNRIKKLSIPKQIAEINSMLDGMGVTEAAIAKMGSTTVGYWAQIGERTEKFMRTIGGMGNSKIGEVLGGVVDKLDSIDLDAIAGKIDAGIGGAIQKVIDFSKKAWEMREPILAVAKAVGIFVGTVTGIVVAVKTVGLVGAAFAFLTSPIGLAALAIIGIVTAFKAAYKHSEPFRKAIDGIVGSFKGLFKFLQGDRLGAMGDIIGSGLNIRQAKDIERFAIKLKDAFGKVKTVIGGVSNIFAGNKVDGGNMLIKAGLSPEQFKLVNKFAYGLRGAFDKVKNIFDGLGTLISGGGSSDLLTALGFSPEAIAGIFAFVENVKTKVSEFVAYLGAKWTELQPGIALLMNAFVTAKDFIVNAFTTIWNFAQPVVYALGVALGILADIAVMVFNNVIAPGVSRMITAFQTAWSIISPTLELLGFAIGVAFGVLKFVWDTILQPFVEFLLGGFKSAFEKTEGILESIGGVFDWVGERISGVVDWFSTVVDAVKNFKVPDWLSKLGGGGTVKFESSEGGGGGSVKSNYHGIDYVPYDGFQTRLHKGESVVTAQENREKKQGGGSGGGVSITGNTFHVRQESDIKDIAEQLYQKIYEAGEAGA